VQPQAIESYKVNRQKALGMLLEKGSVGRGEAGTGWFGRRNLRILASLRISEGHSAAMCCKVRRAGVGTSGVAITTEGREDRKASSLSDDPRGSPTERLVVKEDTFKDLSGFKDTRGHTDRPHAYPCRG
jgi:hypothetical protein